MPIGANFSQWTVNATNAYTNTNVSLAYNQPYSLGPEGLFSGWNLSYSVASASNDTWNTSFTQNAISSAPVTLSGVQSSIIFTESFENEVLSANNTSWLFVQTSNFTLSIQQCTTGSNSSTCSLLNSTSTLTAPISGISNSIQILPNGQQVIVTAVAYNQTIGLFYSSLQNSMYFQNLGQLISGSNVTDVEFAGTALTAAFSSTAVDIYILEISNSYIMHITQIPSIDNTTIANWPAPVGAQWNPINIHTSNVYPNRLVVECTQGLWVIGYNYQQLTPFYLAYISTLSTVGAGQPWTRLVSVFSNYISFIESNSTAFSQITEYALFNPLAPVQT